MNRRMLISFSVVTVGVVAYLIASGAPSKVDVTEVTFQVVFLALVSFVAWRDSTIARRVLAIAALVFLGYLTRSIALNAVMSKQIDLREPIFIGAGVALLLGEVCALIASTWLIEKTLVFFRK